MDDPKRDAELGRWVRLLDTVAATAGADMPAGLAPWFLYSRGRDDKPAKQPTALDDILWSAVASGSPGGFSIPQVADPSRPAAMVPFDDAVAIEVWTERDLSAMHALSRLMERAGAPGVVARLEAAVRWHIEFTQPDNATGRPWALHLFVRRWVDACDAEARLYAETLLHNCQMLAGAPDPLSGEILRDSADALRALISDEHE